MKIVDECDESSHNYLSVKVLVTEISCKIQLLRRLTGRTKLGFISWRAMLNAIEVLRWRNSLSERGLC